LVCTELNGNENKFIFSKENDSDLFTTTQKIMEGSSRKSFENIYEFIRVKVREVDVEPFCESSKNMI